MTNSPNEPTPEPPEGFRITTENPLPHDALEYNGFGIWTSTARRSLSPVEGRFYATAQPPAQFEPPEGSCLVCGQLRSFAVWSGDVGVCGECRNAKHDREQLKSEKVAAEKERDELREDKAILDWLEKMLKQSPKHWGLVHINTLPEHAQVGACNKHHGLEAGSIIAPTLREAARTAIRAARLSPNQQNT